MELNRSVVIDRNFRNEVLAATRPSQSDDPDKAVTPNGSLTGRDLVKLLFSQLKSRAIDIVARELRAINEGFYTISSSGHEGNGLVAHHTSRADMSFLHYRSGAYMMVRSDQVPGTSPIYDTCLSLVASAEDPISGGRHKVWGSVELNVPPQTSTIASHLPKTVGAAFAFERTPAKHRNKYLTDDSIFIATFGDASLNHSTAQGALNSAGWASYQNLPVPVLFVCEDNGLGISVRTPGNWVKASLSQRPGIKYFFADGRDAVKGSDAVKDAVDYVRTHRRPAVLHLQVVRLLGHAGSDPEYRYRSEDQIVESESQDPVLNSAKHVIARGLMSPEEVIHAYDEVLERTRRAGKMASSRPRHECAETVCEPLTQPLDLGPTNNAPEAARSRFWNGKLPETKPAQIMSRLLNSALGDILLADERVTIFGEDVAKKGGVYTITNGLSRKFGLKRVFNTLLDEQTILGLAIGAAQIGQIPIPEIQYLAYLHNAVDQIRGEASSLGFFSNRQFANPMVIRIASFAYQKGFGGHFHNDNSIASIRDIPGIFVVTFSTPADGVKLLRTSYELARQKQAVVCFLEPIALYMQRDLAEAGDGEFTEVYPEPGEHIDVFEDGYFGSESAELLVLSYANGTYLTRQAIADLGEDGERVRIMDLRWLAPLNKTAIRAAIRQAKRVLIVDEGREQGGVHESLSAILVSEPDYASKAVKLVVGDDTFIPLGRAWAHVLPSRERIADALRSMLAPTAEAEPAAESRV